MSDAFVVAARYEHLFWGQALDTATVWPEAESADRPFRPEASAGSADPAGVRV